jgi:hypothetical protein
MFEKDRRMKILLITLLVLSTITLGGTKPEFNHSPPLEYKGYGSKTAALFLKECPDKIIVAICLAEHGGMIPENGNVGNVRYGKEFKQFKNWKEGLKHLQKVLHRPRYRSCFNLPPKECIQEIQKRGYCPEKEWVKRVTHWYDLINP